MIKRIKEARLREGFRFIQPQDVDKAFHSSDPRVDTLGLDDYLAWSQQDESSAIILYLMNDEIAGLLALRTEPGYLYVALVARNYAIPDSGGAGTALMSLAPNIAKQLGLKTIKLDAFVERVNWYHDLGYEKDGNEVVDAKKGRLQPMRMNLV